MDTLKRPLAGEAVYRESALFQILTFVLLMLAIFQVVQ